MAACFALIPVDSDWIEWHESGLRKQACVRLERSTKAVKANSRESSGKDWANQGIPGQQASCPNRTVERGPKILLPFLTPPPPPANSLRCCCGIVSINSVDCGK